MTWAHERHEPDQLKSCYYIFRSTPLTNILNEWCLFSCSSWNNFDAFKKTVPLHWQKVMINTLINSVCSIWNFCHSEAWIIPLELVYWITMLFCDKFFISIKRWSEWQTSTLVLYVIRSFSFWRADTNILTAARLANSKCKASIFSKIFSASYNEI